MSCIKKICSIVLLSFISLLLYTEYMYSCNICMCLLKSLWFVSRYFRRNCSVFSFYKVYISLHRDGTDGQATIFWSLKPSGFNSKAVTLEDIGPFNGSVVFLSGQSDTTINITVQADDIPEMNETVTLSLDR